MKNLIYTGCLFAGLCYSVSAYSQQQQFDPPWNSPPESSINFTIPGIDNVPDLFGDIVNPQLVIFFAGNQFMCVDDLLIAFKKQYPQYQRIFVETLPPGILAQQTKGGSVTIGNMRIDLQPDIYTAGKTILATLMDKIADTATYCSNKLAIMVRKGNPKNIKSLADLGRADIKVSMPNPAWEGIGKKIEEAYTKVGGEALRTSIMKTKLADSSTFLTKIHHRQTPMRVMYGQSDAGPVWVSEALYQQMIGHPVESITLPPGQNIIDNYIAALMKQPPHPEAAKAFMQFLQGETAKRIYRKYGFEAE